MSDTADPSIPGHRGPVEHGVRDQIVDAADKHFTHYGYSKTTVADLARSIGFSKAYIYKFFDSKQAIGIAICDRILTSIVEAAGSAIQEQRTPTAKFRILWKIIATMSCELFFKDRHLYDLAAVACMEKWPSTDRYRDTIAQMLTDIITEGRLAGEFERKMPLDEAVRAMLLSFQPFMNPAMLQYNLDAVPEGTAEVTNLYLRSLAP